MLCDILKQLPQDHPWGSTVQYFDTIGSTNTAAKALAAQGAPQGTVLIAGQQTGGRGRLGRSFHSPAGMGLYLSVILRPQCRAAELMHLTCAVAVAVCEAVEASLGICPGIKWTNDLIWEDRKLGGILTELSLKSDGTVDYAVAGIGLNCLQGTTDFPEDIRDIAASLSMAAGAPVMPAKVAAALLCALHTMTQNLLTADWISPYEQRCITLGREISLVRGDTVRHGTAVAVDRAGALLVRFPDGHTEAINSGEVSVRGMYGYV